jgi:hypothetical protein
MVGHSRPVDGGGAVSAFHPFATKSARATNAALGQQLPHAPAAKVASRLPRSRSQKSALRGAFLTYLTVGMIPSRGGSNGN